MMSTLAFQQSKTATVSFFTKGAMRKCILEQRNLFCTWKDSGSRQREKIYIYITAASCEDVFLQYFTW